MITEADQDAIAQKVVARLLAANANLRSKTPVRVGDALVDIANRTAYTRADVEAIRAAVAPAPAGTGE